MTIIYFHVTDMTYARTKFDEMVLNYRYMTEYNADVIISNIMGNVDWNREKKKYLMLLEIEVVVA